WIPGRRRPRSTSPTTAAAGSSTCATPWKPSRPSPRPSPRSCPPSPRTGRTPPAATRPATGSRPPTCPRGTRCGPPPSRRSSAAVPGTWAGATSRPRSATGHGSPTGGRDSSAQKRSAPCSRFAGRSRAPPGILLAAPPEVEMTPETKRAARDATAAAEAMVASVEADYPDVWPRLDRMRASRGSSPDLDWPDWCLLPMGACAAVAQTRPEVLARRPSIIAEMSAAYAWRYTRSVYLVADHLQGRLLTQVPDALPLEDVTGLPEWCIAVASTPPEWPGISLWVHLEWDTRNRRPELRLLLSHTDPPVAVPV